MVFGVTLALDFKLNFDPNDADKIDRIHERTAQRLSRLVDQNVGMYVKLAQALAIQAAILPKPYREAFANVFDGAPAVSWEEVVRVFRNEFGCHPDDAFDSFERVPLASASIAQVHKARLKTPDPNTPWKDDEGWVAVKIRKEAVPKQMEWCVSPPGLSADRRRLTGCLQGSVLLSSPPLELRKDLRPPRRLRQSVRVATDASGGQSAERGE